MNGNTDILRGAIVGLVVLVVCSSLLGVMLGWWLRGQEVRRLQGKLQYTRDQLTRAWAKRATPKMEAVGKAVQKVIVEEGAREHRHTFATMTGKCMYCPLTYAAWVTAGKPQPGGWNE